jgi:Kdo2-lipid IVA lauroyltransferase/acyltransferase
MRLFGHWLVYLTVRVVICAVQAMRLETCQWAARVLAVLACDVIRLRRRVVDENLAIAFPRLSPDERRRLARRMWEHLFLMVAEIAQAPRRIHANNWRQYIRIRDERQVVEFLNQPRPKVLVSGHYGNFELCGYVLGLLGYPTYSVARPLDNPFLNELVNRFRGATGQFILPKTGSAVQIDQLLASGGTLAVLGDQAAGPKGCWVEFFGRPASTNKAIPLFSLANNAPLAVGYARRLDRPLCYEVGFIAVFDPAECPDQLAAVGPLSQWYCRQLEALIRVAPEQYWWIHRRWKGSPPARRPAQTAPSRAA